ncbi:hypothetical protein Trydic_g5450 [Trypoxylus dichotomus]
MLAANPWIILTLACSVYAEYIGGGDLGLRSGSSDSGWQGIDSGSSVAGYEGYGGSDLDSYSSTADDYSSSSGVNDIGGGEGYHGLIGADLSSQDEHIEVPQKTVVYPKPIPVTVVKKIPVPVPNPVGVSVPQPIRIPVPQPYLKLKRKYQLL